MKNILFIVILLLGLTAATAGCEKQAANQAHTPAMEDLIHHNYVLVSVDGQAYANQERVPHISFNQGFNISGAVCNRFTGQGELVDGIVYLRNAASTKMFCVEEGLNQLETLFHEMLQKGASITLEDQRLTMSQGNHTLVYALKDLVN